MGKIVTLSKSNTIVTVGKTVDELVIQKTLIKITLPTSTTNYGSGAKPTKIVDLLKLTFVHNIEGVIHDTLGTGDTSSLAKDKKDDLRTIIDSGGLITMTIGTDTYTGNIEKLTIKEIPNDLDEDPNEYDIKFTFIEGEDL